MAPQALVCLALLAVATAVPTNRQRWDRDDSAFDSYSCAEECPAASKYNYQPDTTYHYAYSVETATTMAGATKDSAKLSIQAQVEIQVIDKCEMALKLKQVRVSHSDAYTGRMTQADREDEFRRALERNILRFAFLDGDVRSVCPEEGETGWALNFKRGLLSAFQDNRLQMNFDHVVEETDVSGKCPTEYSTNSQNWMWKDQVIIKEKNMTSCRHRDNYQAAVLQAVSYDVPSSIQSSPFVTSKQRCENTVDSAKYLKKSTCTESHVYVPFSNRESGGRTTVKQELSFTWKRSTIDISKGPIAKRTGLLFEQPEEEDKMRNSREAAQQKLKELCEQTRDSVRPETPRLYSELVSILQVLDKAELHSLYRQLKDKVICPRNDRTLKFFLDALPMAGTSGPIGLMTTLISSKDVDGLMAKAWLTTLALVKDPESLMFEGLAYILNGPYFDSAILPVSALLGTYCKKVPQCDQEQEVSRTIKAIENKIPYMCKTPDKDLGQVLKTLKGIGNTGLMTGVLDSCLTSSYSPLEVKVAAADAYRRVPCDKNMRQVNGDQTLWNILRDPSLDPELKITSYLAIMRCPNKRVLDKVANLLSVTEDDQLGSFIFSHLNNLKETSDPLKKDVAKAVSELTLKEFDLNPIKYSRNYEASVLVNRLNMGLTADSNVILSSESPFPRAAMLNMTFHLFGNSINALEFGGRAEGLENLAEWLLGPYGYSINKAGKKGDDKLDDVTGSVYARIFGNEILFEHVKGLKGLAGRGKIPNFLDVLIKLANKQDFSFTHSQKIMDKTIMLPTAAGLPLDIHVNGSLTLDLKAEGKADLRKVSSSPRSLDIEGELRPSAALEITGTMAIDAHIAKMGLRMRNTMHSATGIKGHIQMNRGRELSVEIDPPKDQMEIFNAKSEFFIVHNEVEKYQDMIEENRKDYKACTGDKLAKILGVELCADLQFPNASHEEDAPYFPLTGPSSFSVVTFKRDTHTSYKLFAKRAENKRNSIAQFLMDTPNSRINRMISTDLTIAYAPKKQLDIILVSPWKKVNLNSEVVANKDMISVGGSILVDDKDKYGLTTEVKITKNRQGDVYTPFVELTTRGRTLTLLSGQVNIDVPEKLDANLELGLAEGKAVTVKGRAVNTDKEKGISLSVNEKGQSSYLVDIGSTIEKNGKGGRNIRIEPKVFVKTPQKKLISITGFGDYKPNKINKKGQSQTAMIADLSMDIYRMKSASLNLNVKSLTSRRQDRYDVDVRLKSALVTGKFDGFVTQRKNVMTSKVKVNYNVPRLGKDVISWNTKFNDRSKNALTKYTMSSNFDSQKNPEYNAGVNFDLDHKRKQSKAKMTIRYGPNPKDKKKQVSLSTSVRKNIKSMQEADIDLRLEAKAPEKDVDFNMKMSHFHSPAKLDTSMNLKFEPMLRDTVDANIKLADKSSKLTKLVGQADFEMGHRKVILKTDLTQKSAKQYAHSMDLIDSSSGKHSINTLYRTRSGKDHEITTNLNIDGYTPIQIEGKTTLDPSNFLASCSANCGNEVHRASTQLKFVKGRAGKWNLDIVTPYRQIEAEVQGKNVKDKYDGIISLNWDASKKYSKSKILVDGSYRHSSNWDSRIINGEMKVVTPFESYESLSIDAGYSGDASQYSTKGKISWGGKQNSISSRAVIKRPVSLRNAQITISASTPIRHYRQIEFEVDHKMDPIFDTTVKGKLEDNTGELSFKGENKGNAYNRDFYGKVDLKTSFKPLRNVNFCLEHKDNGRTYTTLSNVEKNGNKYEGKLNMDHTSYNGKIYNNGDLKLSWPGDVLETTWEHQSTDVSKIKSTLESKWGGYKKVTISMHGSNSADYSSRHVQGNVNIQTPWRMSREIFITLDHLLDYGKLVGNGMFRSNGVEKVKYEYLVEAYDNAGNAKFMIKSPLHDHKIEAESRINYRSYPATVLTWVQWTPWARIDFDGSLNAQSLENIDLNTKLTTPFRNYENVIVKASHKLENNMEYMSHAIIDYGVRKMIEFENRYRNVYDGLLLRTKLTSPCPYVKSFETGIRLDKKANGLETVADFELLPFVKKHDGFLSLVYENNDLNGKLRINTPHRELPSLQVTVWSKQNDDSSRASHIDVEPSPHGLYSFDTTYRTSLPYHLDMKLKTPQPEFDNVGFTAMYNPSDDGLQSSLDVVYSPRKEISSQFKLLWSNKYEGSFIVKTPFRGYEINKALVRHDNTRAGFTTHGEGSVAGYYAQTDIVFRSTRSVTTGSASLISPIPGYKKLATTFNLRGKPSQMTGEATLTLGQDNLSTTFRNRYTKDSLKSSLAVQTSFTKDLKLSLQHDDTSTYDRKKYDSTFEGRYGNNKVDGTLSLSHAGLKDSNIDLSVNTPVKSLSLSFNNMMSGEKVSGKGTIKSDVEILGNTAFSYTKTGSLSNMKATANIIRNGETLLDALVETQKPGDEIHGKIVTKGKLLPAFTAQMDHKGIFSNFNTKARLSGKGGNVFNNEITFRIDDTVVDINGKLNYRLSREDHTHELTIHKEGTLNNFKLDISKKCNGKEVKAKLEVETEDKKRGLIQIDNLCDDYQLIKVEFDHSGNLERFLTSGKATLNKDTISGKANFYKYGLQRIEASAELSTPWEDYKYTKVEYRHEGQDSRFSCNFNLNYGLNKKISSDLIMQAAPLHSMSFNVKTPFRGYEEILVSGNFDDSKANGKAVLGKGVEFTLYGVFDDSVYPYHPQYQITTTFDFLEKAILNLHGQPLDGTIDMTVVSSGKKVDINGELHYNSLHEMSMCGQLTSNIQSLETWKLDIVNADDAFKGKTSHFEVSWDPYNQVVLDGRYFSKDSSWASSQEKQFDLDVKLPIKDLRVISLTTGHTSDTSKCETKVGFEVNREQLLDMDLTYEKDDKKAATAVIRKPWPMEYSGSYQLDDHNKEAEIFANWDRDDPSSNFRLKGHLRDSPSSYSTDKTLTLTLTRPSRTMGAEHKYSSSDDKLSSSGKLYWDQDDESKVSYTLDVNGNSRRGDKSFDAVFKLGLPTRTIGVSGSLSNNKLSTSGDAHFRWDLDRDESKQVGIKASLTGKEYTKADLSLELPENFHVDSALILNQGNTIFDGKTDISYSRDARKTLTLYSKVKNVPSSFGYFDYNDNNFNYSVELGVSHPETKVDVTVDSHIGKSSDHLTSSLGVKYLTIRRQKKNLALFAEIDKLRKQINLLASTPAKSIGVSGKLVREEPLRVELDGSVDGQKKIRSNLDVDTERKTVKFEIGQPDNLLSLDAFYPNSSAIQAELHHKKNYRDSEESLVVLRLVAPMVIHSKIQWKPETIGELKRYAIEQISVNGDLVKQTLRELNRDIQYELAGKYRDITSSVVDDLKPLLRYVETELESFGRDIDAAKQKLRKMRRDNEFHLQDISSFVADNFNTASRSYAILQDELQSLSDLYRQSCRNIISTISVTLDFIKKYPLADKYSHLVSQTVEDLLVVMDHAVQSLTEFLRQEDLKIMEAYKVTLEKLGDTVQLEKLQAKIEELKNFDYTIYVDRFFDNVKNGVEQVQSLHWKPYTDVVYRIQDATVNKIVPEYVRDTAATASNEVYQQAKWAYNYWKVEENLKKNLVVLVELLKEIVYEEQQEFFTNALSLESHPIHVFQPEKGRIEFDLYLPIKLNRLDRLPDFAPYIDQVSDMYQKYVPSRDTFSKYVPDIWTSNETTSDRDEVFEQGGDDFDDEDFNQYYRAGYARRQGYFKNRVQSF